MTLAPHDTQRIPQGDDYYSKSAPPPPPPTEPAQQSGPTPPRKDRHVGQTVVTALLAAVLASGGTYAVTQYTGQDTASSTSTTTASNQGSSPTVVQGNGSNTDWTAVAAAVSPSVVSIDVNTQQGAAAGSGVVLDNSGHILTNNHVVADAAGQNAITVTLSDGLTYGATVVGTDPSTDLAVLKLTSVPGSLVPMTLGDSDALKVGDPVMAVGNPLGLSGTVTTGIVSALNRPVSTTASDQNQSPFGQQSAANAVVTNAIQTSAAINPGNSGGALVNAKGELVGINSSIASLSQGGSQSGNIGIGFAIPVNEAKSIADQLIKSGTAEHAFLGVTLRDTVVKEGNAQRAGAEIATVESGTPAAKAGLQQGDVVVAIDGHRIDSAEALVAAIREMTAGDATKLTVIRNGSSQDVSVTLAVRPSSSG
jgi:putative serine protease PepD